MEPWVKIGKWESRLFGCGALLIVVITPVLCGVVAWAMSQVK